ncbi:hypothetical protein [Streptomyces antimycoticus]|uniref:hypothetical protein n=1 Tax=Streptomyces antimycoticus TaxID=68175 RepID=UPI0033C75735
MMPAAAVAVIRATLEDTATGELISRPRSTAVRVALALEAAGWALAPIEAENGPETPAHAFVTVR